MAATMGLSGNMDPTALAMASQGAKAQAYFFIYASTALGVVATIAVILRMLARWRIKGPLGIDDIWISLSLIPLWSLIGSGIVSMYKCKATVK